MRKIIFYRTDSGKCPVEEFLDSLNAKEAQKATWVLRLVEELPRIPSHYFKKLAKTDDTWERRTILGGNIISILGFWEGPNLFVLTHGFHKKTQKTPPQAIKLAEARKRDCFQRRRKK